MVTPVWTGDAPSPPPSPGGHFWGVYLYAYLAALRRRSSCAARVQRTHGPGEGGLHPPRCREDGPPDDRRRRRRAHMGRQEHGGRPEQRRPGLAPAARALQPAAHDPAGAADARSDDRPAFHGPPADGLAEPLPEP